MNLYIHIPFCRKRCHYCDFYTLTTTSLIEDFTKALQEEIKSRLIGIPIQHIYFGGGTPSLLSIGQLEDIFSTINSVTTFDKNGEITIEVNPDDITKEYAAELIQLPFNRVSMGVQSFIDKDLIFLNRRHSAEKAISALKYLRSAGFNNISIDLIYGLPGQTKNSWMYNLDMVIEMEVEHISAYHLIYEEGTPLTKMRNNGIIREVSEEDSLTFFSNLIEKLSSHGYEHYEISNFAKENYTARLNSDYWNGSPYIGVGPAAHSYDGENTRRVNNSNLKDYIKFIGTNDNYFTIEKLSHNERCNEYLLTRMRTKNGINIKDVENKFGKNFTETIINNSKKYIISGHIISKENTLSLATKGIFISDSIIADLFI